MFGKNLYYISILGMPSEKEPWMLQFGGHHLALNITIVGDRGTLTPSLTGAQPGTYTANGKTVRPLGQENDKGFALLNALDDGQRKQAIEVWQEAVRRDPKRAPGVPDFKSKDSVLHRPDGDPASPKTVAPGQPLSEVLPLVSGPGAVALVLDGEDKLMGMLTSENLSEFILLRQAEMTQEKRQH